MPAHSLTSVSLFSITSSSELRKFNGGSSFLRSANSCCLLRSFTGNQLAIGQHNPNRFALKRQSTIMTVSFSLPIRRVFVVQSFFQLVHFVLDF